MEWTHEGNYVESCQKRTQCSLVGGRRREMLALLLFVFFYHCHVFNEFLKYFPRLTLTKVVAVLLLRNIGLTISLTSRMGLYFKQK